jgi:hypothetical protein
MCVCILHYNIDCLGNNSSPFEEKKIVSLCVCVFLFLFATFKCNGVFVGSMLFSVHYKSWIVCSFCESNIVLWNHDGLLFNPLTIDCNLISIVRLTLQMMLKFNNQYIVMAKGSK